MPPRRYRMDARLAAREETRRRIVEATMALHTERGVVATSWEDIARRADVAVATVYRYFPSLDELVAGCGARVMETIRPPAAGDAAKLFEGAANPPARLRRLAAEFCAFYERAEKPFAVMHREWEHVAGLRHVLEGHRATLDAYVAEALRPAGPDGRTLRVAAALVDFPMWQSIAERGVERGKIADVIAALLVCWTGKGGAGVGK